MPAGPLTYEFNANTSVWPNATLTIDPGVIVKFGGGQGLDVAGTLDAVGTPQMPIEFTSIDDNSVGGATGTGVPAPGASSGITIDSSASIDLENASVDYGGNPNWPSISADTLDTPITLVNDQFYDTRASPCSRNRVTSL